MDGGRFGQHAFFWLHAPSPDAYIHTLNFGAIGLGMGNAIGAAVESDRPTLLVVGDGGFMLGGVGEFSTAVRHQLDLVTVVLNDRAYGAEYHHFVSRDIDPSISTFDWPPFEEVARALGGEGYTATSLAELDVALEKIHGRSGPTLIDVHLDPTSISLPGI